eukprot:6183582-Pleurochrysis_carterae.AAC.4
MSPAAASTNEPGAKRPAMCSSLGGVLAACRCSAISVASMPPIDQPTRSMLVPAASSANRSASREIILASAASASADATSPAGASAGHAKSASAPLPGISTATTSSHSGACFAKSLNATVEPPA